MDKNRKILILGGEGFIGRNIANFLSGHYDCYSVGIEKSKFDGRKDRFIRKNIYKDRLKNNYAAIIHLIDNPVRGEKFFKEEKKLIKNLELNENNHLIVFSSAAVYANPDSDYGKRKLKLEKIYSDYCKNNGIKLTIFRLFNVFGPYQIPNRQGSLAANTLVNYLNGKTVAINDKKAKRDFIFSPDIGKFIRYVIKNSVTGKFDLATNEMVTIEALIKKIETNVIKNKLPLDYKYVKEEIVCPKAKNKLLENVKTTSLEDGLKKTFVFYKNNLKTINKLSL